MGNGNLARPGPPGQALKAAGLSCGATWAIPTPCADSVIALALSWKTAATGVGGTRRGGTCSERRRRGHPSCFAKLIECLPGTHRARTSIPLTFSHTPGALAPPLHTQNYYGFTKVPAGGRVPTSAAQPSLCGLSLLACCRDSSGPTLRGSLEGVWMTDSCATC